MKALVIGAAGGFGGAVARELLLRGHEVVALKRPGGRDPALPGAVVAEGDARDVEALDRAAAGVDVIVWGFHLPYTEWVPGAVQAARAAAEVAARRGATVLFPGNVYVLGDDLTGPADERAPHRPVTELGRIRCEIESIFQEATTRGARVVIVRAGDYLGPNPANTWLGMMTTLALSGGRILDPGSHGLPHAWAYVPDLARAGVRLLEKREAFSPFETFHFAGYDVDVAEMIRSVQRALGDPRRKTLPFPWWLLRMLAPFVRMVRLLLTMSYLWRKPVTLDGGKLRRALPDFAVTPLDEAVRRSLGSFAEARGIAVPALRDAPIAEVTPATMG